jgi:hypothetical protein
MTRQLTLEESLQERSQTSALQKAPPDIILHPYEQLMKHVDIDRGTESGSDRTNIQLTE